MKTSFHRTEVSLNINTKSRQGEVKIKYVFNQDEKVQRYESKREKSERDWDLERERQKESGRKRESDRVSLEKVTEILLFLKIITNVK